MKKINKYVIMLLSVAFAATTEAQDKVEGSMGVEFVNQYIWRGLDLGDVSAQPSLGLSYQGLSLSAWGSVGITDATDTKELDLTLSYALGDFHVGITDYWFSGGSYFQYQAHKTTHVWEANVGYDFGVASVQWYTNIGGDDGLNKDGDRAYSSYLELSAPFQLGGLDWSAAVGIVPWATTFYNANGFAVTNVSLRATKDIAISDRFHLPVYVGLTANPRSERMYLLLGTSFSL